MKALKEITVRRMNTKMTRCKEFYEKMEKDGNFCGMPRRSFEDAKKYWEDYRKEAEENGENSPLSEDKWIRGQRKEAASHKFVEPEEPKEKPIKKLWSKVEQAEYAQEVVRTFIANGVDPAVIRELIVKAIGVVEQE